MENNVILLTPQEASQKFFGGKKSYSAMVAAARKHQLPCIRLGSRIFFEINSLTKFFQIQLDASVKPPPIEIIDGIKRIK